MGRARSHHILGRVKLEYPALVLLAAVSAVVYRLHYFEFMTLPLGATAGVLLFIVMNRFSANNELTLSSPRMPETRAHTVRLIFSILFFVFYGLSFLALLQASYTKTVAYYLSIALCTGFIAADILFVKTEAQGYLNLLKSFLLVLNIGLSNQMLFPYGIGLQDARDHMTEIVLPVVNTGHVPSGLAYSPFPGHHILVAASSLVSGADPWLLYYCLGGFVMSLGLLFVFLIGRKFISPKFGLFAALVFACCDFLMHYAAHPVHMTYTYFLSIAIFAVVLYLYHSRDVRFVVLFFILSTTMIFTHHFSAAVILLMLVTVLLLEVVTRIREPGYRLKTGTLTALFGVAMFTHWIYMKTIMMGQVGGLLEAYSSAFSKASTKVSTATVFAEMPLSRLVMNNLGSGILMMLGLIGFFHFLNHSSPFKRIVLAIAIVLLAFIAFETVFKESYLESHRMYAYLQEFSFVFLVSCAIVWMLGNFTRLRWVPIVLLVMLSFFSLASLVHGQETSIFRGNGPYVKLYDTPYERYSIAWAEQHLPAGAPVATSGSLYILGSSSLVHDMIPIKEKEITSTDERVHLDTEKLESSDFLILSQYDIDIGFEYGVVAPPGESSYTGGNYYVRLDQGTPNTIQQDGKLYDNGMVSIYYII